ncbi:MurR/RpiR family transcriptional regulator [Pseudarthrobacter sp. J47]|uniref:MurR/RpiR family transcriptional regulator n=1 Tax=Pseudarthrobacter sp. J47 TaxID=3116482 RepID=UPI002E8146C8|nr:MurR/RpiR family transcriptional regulator [Pseudarthrobacter sp. J47]MEE2524515.1 MurR/RpiR family transcriptional regulator [Pseudarthrobacter sp. J47]
MNKPPESTSRFWRADEQPILEQIHRASASFSPSEAQIARAVRADPHSVMTYSVTELAQLSSTSVGSVVRFCQRFGLHGFQEFKLLLSRETVPPQSQDAALDDDPLTATVLGTLRESSGALEAAAAHLDPSAVAAIVTALVNARRVRFAAVGTSAPLASDAAYRFTTLGLDAAFTPDFIAQEVVASGLDERDVCFVISHTGSTTSTLDVARTAAKSKAVVVGITSFLSSPLADIADALLVAGSSETRYRVEAMTSRIVHLSLIDAIYSVLAMRLDGAPEARAASEALVNSHRI